MNINNFFANKLSGLAIVFAIIWWVFPKSLGLYSIYADPELENSSTLFYHLGLGLVFILVILRLGADFFPRNKITRADYKKHSLK